jgi:hypothetical protein
MLEKIVDRFVEIDPRRARPHGYFPSRETNINRFMGFLPPDLVKNKTVLDLGSCVSATGSWSLYHGCKHFTGVEIHKELNQVADAAMKEFFDTGWRLVDKDIETFISSDHDHYDIILMSGVNHCVKDFLTLLEWCVEHSDYIIVEGSNPHLIAEFLTQTADQTIYTQEDRDYLHTLFESKIFSSWFRNFIENKLPIMYFRSTDTVFASRNLEYGHAPTIHGAYTNPGWFRSFFSMMGWKYQPRHIEYLSEHLPQHYTFPHRYCVGFSREHHIKRQVMKDHFQDGLLK